MAPTGYETNFASIPRFAWIKYPPVGKYDPAAVIHDAGYNNMLQTIMGQRIWTTKTVADDLFLEGLTACNVGKRDRQIMYRLVRRFGKPDGPNELIGEKK